MRQISDGWLRFLQVVALFGVAVAAFELGILWHTGQSRKNPPREPRSSKSNAIRTSIRAEFNPQSALLIGANEMVHFQQGVFKSLVGAVHNRIPIIGLVNDEGEAELGRALLEEAGLPLESVNFIRHPLDSMWVRDFGPIFARWSDGEVSVIDARYENADKDTPRLKDDALAKYIGHALDLRVDTMPLAIEGGNLLSNGDGIMVTSTTVIDRPENKRYSVQDIGNMLKKYLGCKTWVYVRPLQGEPTGHADFCMTFLRRNLVVVGQYDPAYDPVNAAILDDMARVLSGLTTSMGQMQVERIPMPPRSAEGDWRSYCNILTVNGVLLMPSYAGVDPAIEKKARETYQALMPSWKVVPINTDSLTPKRGVLHCLAIGMPGYLDIEPLIKQSLF